MALRIRLSRIGAKKQPFYRIVVKEARSKREGEYVESIGTYNPLPNPSEINIDRKKYDQWKQKGAQPSDIVRRLVEGVPRLRSRRPAKKTQSTPADQTDDKTGLKAAVSLTESSGDNAPPTDQQNQMPEIQTGV